MNAAGTSVCVIIAAWNAEKTVARAIASALAQPEVSEVVVVDDASTDATAVVALSASDGTGRLRVIKQPKNLGPSAARNRAIEESKAPLLAILDSDDFFLPGRFTFLLAQSGWDAIVDNLAFIPEDRAGEFNPNEVYLFDPSPETINFSDFVQGNISQRGKPRAELGFIKPVISRAFLKAHHLQFDERLRLGEDFALYSRMLAAGARFRKIATCGYIAVERPESLSGMHRTCDLAALDLADRELLASGLLAAGEHRVLQRHMAHVAAKLHYRTLLDLKRCRGARAALGAAALAPVWIPQVIGMFIEDKVAGWRGPPIRSTIRYLFT